MRKGKWQAQLLAETYKGYARVTFRLADVSEHLFVDFCSTSVQKMMLNGQPLVPSEVCSAERIRIPVAGQRVQEPMIVSHS
jgi:hypothetical protein